MLIQEKRFSLACTRHICRVASMLPGTTPRLFPLLSLAIPLFSPTVFIRIVAAVTFNFSLAGVRLLIEGGSYSRTALIILERYLPLPSVHKNSNYFFRTALWITEIWSKISGHAALEPSQGLFPPCFCLELTIIHHLQLWPHSLNRVRACVRLLFKGGYYIFHRAAGVATIQGAASSRQPY